jgi:hypothetical protein
MAAISQKILIKNQFILMSYPFQILHLSHFQVIYPVIFIEEIFLP